jgi:ssDNA-binding Zn-finger/Zn-ribbon topoisomerase 1
LPEDEGLQDQIQEMEGAAGDGEQGLPDQDEETILLDEEAQEQVATAPDEEGVKLFQDADEQLPEPPADSTATRPAPAEPGSPLDKEDKEKGLDEVVTKPCPECGRAMVRKGDRLGQYWACTGVPACRHTEGAQEKEGDDALKCPLCHQGQLVVKRTPTGKDMYVCRREACEFMAWSKPHAIHCPMCSSSFLVEKKEVSGKIVLRCPKAGCNYSQPMAVGDEQEAPVMRKRVVVRRTAGSSGGSGKRKVVVRRRK